MHREIGLSFSLRYFVGSKYDGPMQQFPTVVRRHFFLRLTFGHVVDGWDPGILCYGRYSVGKMLGVLFLMDVEEGEGAFAGW